MADCFWTDFVRCAEDCGGPPPGPSATPVIFRPDNMERTPGDWQDVLVPFFTDTGEYVLGNLALESTRVFLPPDTDPSFCEGSNYDGSPRVQVTADPALSGVDFDFPDRSDPGSTIAMTWKLYTGVVGDQTGTTGGIILRNNGADGAAVFVSDLGSSLGALNAYGGPLEGFAAAFVVVGTLRNADTDETWTATMMNHTCY